jgi:hypothetical protein
VKVLKINPNDALPLVYARITGKRKEATVKLIFDTGAFMTQLSTLVIEELGYSVRDGLFPISSYGPSGPLDEGYALEVEGLRVFGRKFSKLQVAAYDFSNLEADKIDGLLGFDIIRQMHLELNGPMGELKVF